jgi:hypothetical protein
MSAMMNTIAMGVGYVTMTLAALMVLALLYWLGMELFWKWLTDGKNVMSLVPELLALRKKRHEEKGPLK